MTRHSSFTTSSSVCGRGGRDKWQRSRRERGTPAPLKQLLRLHDMDLAKSAVLNSLSSPHAQRGYTHAIEEFIEWYCSEPRLSFSKPSFSGIVSTWSVDFWHPAQSICALGRYAVSLARPPIGGAAKPRSSAGIRRVKGVKKIGVRLGNWLTPEQSWIVLGQGFSRKAFEDDRNLAEPAPETIQILYLLQSTWNAVSAIGAQLKILCSE